MGTYSDQVCGSKLASSTIYDKMKYYTMLSVNQGGTSVKVKTETYIGNKKRETGGPEEEQRTWQPP